LFGPADYASVVFVGFAAISAVWYVIGKIFFVGEVSICAKMLSDGRHRYTGPPEPKASTMRGSDEKAAISETESA